MVTSMFETVAKTISFKKGMPLQRIVYVPHPVAGRPESLLREYIEGKDPVTGKEVAREIIDALEQTDQLDNTIIIFTSDHGELLGDHGLLYKGCRFFESLVHVPLIISWPARFQKSVISKDLVELVDLAPTLMEAAGLEVPHQSPLQ